MNAEAHNDCTRLADEIERLGCGVLSEPTAELRAHLVGCATCRERVAENAAFLDELRLALAPEPLPTGLEAKVWARLEQTAGNAARIVPPARRAWRLALPTAAAAAAALAVFLFPREAAQPPHATRSVAEAPVEGAAAVQSVCAVLWDGLSELSMDDLQTQAAQAVQAVEQGRSTQSALPWGTDDDWDLPRAASDSSRVGDGARDRELGVPVDICLAGCDSRA